MLRVQISEALKSSMKAKAQRATSTLRLILAAMKDRDIAARGKGGDDEISDDEILGMLQKMIEQRHESIEFYKQGGRLDLAKEEAEEIEIIERFLPKRLDEKETTDAISAVIDELGAANIKDMGRTMAALKQSYAGRMDFSKVSTIVKQRLGGV
ncbi:MAG: GatB/YqeY domain-containing protein [Proteobacteria bacterium]|nr:GatB/YqeY domain-containing protein [Pseudomonadota bacterium]TDI59481.1 MAG: GatB/YqeY domain-containing protein [Alphaproteobacteria bacterium]